jgi:hypothetical protein
MDVGTRRCEALHKHADLVISYLLHCVMLVCHCVCSPAPADSPVMGPLQPVVEALLLDVCRHPVGLLIVHQQPVLE